MLLFFAISRYLTDKYFDIVRGATQIDLSQKSIFWMAQLRELVFYDISRYLTDKYFDILWECYPQGPPNGPSQKSIFWMAQLRVPICFDISRYLTDKYFDIVWGCHPPGTPQMDPQTSIFERLNLGCQCFMISADILLTIIVTLLFWRFHDQIFLNNCWFYGRQKVLLSVTSLGLRRSFSGFAGKPCA